MGFKKPPFMVIGVTVDKWDRIHYEAALTNWHKTRKFIEEKGLSQTLIQKLMWVEMHMDKPREGILRKLLQRYNSVRRQDAEAELEDYLKANKTTPVNPDFRKPKKSETVAV